MPKYPELIEFTADASNELQTLSLPLTFALEGGGNPLHQSILSANDAVIYMAPNLSYVQYFCVFSRGIFACLVSEFIACLVSSFRYNGLATLALVGPSGPRAGPSGPLRALRARICTCLLYTSDAADE